MPRVKRQNRLKVMRYEAATIALKQDFVAAEEPLEIRLEAEETKTLAITMRTPGNDFELVAGHLFSEGLVQTRADIKKMSYCVDGREDQQYNIVKARLATMPDLAGLERHVYTSSACGVCGKTNLEALSLAGYQALERGFIVPPEVIISLPDSLRASQGLFNKTGGLHAAALFNLEGKLLALREDVGRHNALDKLLGWGLLEARLAFTEHILLLSGRISYELMQKALRAGVQMVCAISAPSSLAVDVARRFDISLIGFLRADTFNVYAVPERLQVGPKNDLE